MKVEFYFKETGEVIEQPEGMFFVMNDKVFCDNGWSCESQEATVSFDDFINELPRVGWRVVT